MSRFTLRPKVLCLFNPIPKFYAYLTQST